MAQKQCEGENSPVRHESPRPSPAIFNAGHFFSAKKNKKIYLSSVPPSPKLARTIRRSSFISQKEATLVSISPSLSPQYCNINLPKSYFSQCFDVIDELGCGSFAQVFKVRSKEDGRFYAIKKSKRKYLSHADRRRKLNEVEKYEKLPKHINCIEFYKAWEENGDLYIQLELCEMSLAQYCNDEHNIPESTVWNIFIDLLLALKHVHDNDIIHLDIKPDNIFISDDICKLGDFGLALDTTKVNPDPDEGDSKYLAPEIMTNVFSKAADMFSLGMTILEVASDLDVPKGESPWRQLRQNEIPDQFLMKLSPELRLIIQQMMEKNYEVRPSVNDVLNMKIVQHFLEKRKQNLDNISRNQCFEQPNVSPAHCAMPNLPTVCDDSNLHHLSTELGKETGSSCFSANYDDGAYKTDQLTDGVSLLHSALGKFDENTNLPLASSSTSKIQKTPRKFKKLSATDCDTGMVSPCKCARILEKEF